MQMYFYFICLFEKNVACAYIAFYIFDYVIAFFIYVVYSRNKSQIAHELI